MTSIPYTYEIILVDEVGRSMEIVYTSPVYGTQHVGARLPFEGETLEQIITMYSPVTEWRLSEVPVQVPPVGLSGEMVDVPPEPIPTDPKELYRQAVQAHIDATAQSRNYEDGFALAGYTSSTVAPWRAEAETFVAWRDQVWLFVFETLAQIEAGTTPAPESPAALIGWLPVIEWP